MLRLSFQVAGRSRCWLYPASRVIRIEQSKQKSMSSWLNRVKQPKRQRDNPKPQMIIEEEKNDNTTESTYISDLKHYLKTTEIPSGLRNRILTTKLTSLIHEVPDFACKKDNLHTIDNVFNYLYKFHEHSIEKVISPDDLFTLFRRTSSALLAQQNFRLPQYMAILAQQLIRSNLEIPTDIYAIIIDLGYSMKFNGFEDALSVVVRNSNALPSDFTKAVLEHFKEKNRLTYLVFEAFVSVGSSTKSDIINTDFCNEYCAFFELLFADLYPDIHEYENVDKNIYRIEELTLRMFGFLTAMSTESIIKLLKFFADLNTVVEHKDKAQGIQTLLSKINERPIEDIKLSLLKLDIFDESQCHVLLLELSKHAMFPLLHKELTELIIQDDVRYSAGLRLQAELLSHLQRESEVDENEVFEWIQRKVSLAPTKELDNAQDRVLEALMASGLVSPDSELVYLLQDWFRSEYDDFPSLKSFHCRIESAIDASDSNLAFKIFEESLRCDSVHWEHDSSPQTQLLLNKLIRLVCDNDRDIMELFPVFQKIKQHMRSPCNAEVLSVISEKMVEGECVGDCIELLKRELPKIKSESPKRIMVKPSWAYAHKKLFDKLYEFTVTFTNEETFETNWVLYGELHKYFAVPYETYLPTMKFFCDKDRLHAALVVFQTVKSLNELHGSHHHQPPSREMYMYLFKTFGDRLYEEGVVEIHEYLKMDVTLQDADIDLQNCLLDAYSNLQNVGKARDLFLSISSNLKLEGGVNEETVRIMIKTYTYSDMMYVKKFWNNLSQFGVFPDYGIFKQYVIAHVYHGHVDDAFKLIDDIDDYNLELSSDLLLAMHNYCLDPEKQTRVAKWAIENHKEEWEKVSLSSLLRKASKYMPDSNLLTDQGTDS